MAYSSEGKRPFELASKTNHSFIIKDPAVQAFLKGHVIPSEHEHLELISDYIVNVDYDKDDDINFIIAVDGGDTTVPIKSKFPSSQLTFFQFGANLLSVSDLNALKEEPFIAPQSISKLKDLERFKFTLPTKNIGLKLEDGKRATLNYSVRKAVYDFFKQHNFLSTLKWFLYHEYKKKPLTNYVLASHPIDAGCKNIDINREDVSDDYIIERREGNLFLTDVFRLHEVVDEEIGAGGIIGYLRNLLEHFILIDAIRGIYKDKKKALQEVLFIKDGPLGFFGQTANMHEPMRELINFLQQEENIYLTGIEKSGPFVEHALEIAHLLDEGQAYLLSNYHIYKYIKPGDPTSMDAYGSTSYYGSKTIFKSRDGRLYVLTLPTSSSDVVLDPRKKDFRNLDIILKYIEKLRSDMYDNAILPIALANKLVSISDHPSSKILEKFAKKTMG